MSDMPDAIYAWWLMESKRDDVVSGGWHFEPDMREKKYLAATPAREAAPELLEALEDLLEVCAHSVGELDPREPIKAARAAIAKARGQS